ncbi:MAG: hypothetical protein Q9220_004007 [cf. Caloplaca sp. 1 TL-2023]
MYVSLVASHRVESKKLKSASYFGIQFADMIIKEETVNRQVFSLIRKILYVFEYLAEISLLGVLYLLLPGCLSQDRYHENFQMRKVLKTIHLSVILILSALFIAAMALKIDDQVTSVIIDTAYAIIYFFASLEIVAGSVVAFLDARKDSQPAQKQLFLVALIALPLLVRSTYMMGATIYGGLQNHYGDGFDLATVIIYNLTTLAIYGGIVAICKKIHLAHSGPNQMDPAADDPNFWDQHQQQPGPNTPGMNVNEAAPLMYQPGTLGGQGQQYAPLPQQEFQLQQYPSPQNQHQQQPVYQNHQGAPGGYPPQSHSPPPPQQMMSPVPQSTYSELQSPPPQQSFNHAMPQHAYGGGAPEVVNSSDMARPATGGQYVR